MTAVNKYRIWCETEEAYREMWSESVPTTCTSGVDHTIDADATTIIETVSSNDVSLVDKDGHDLGHVSSANNHVLLVQNEPRIANRVNFISPNWCDSTTWYYNADEVTSGVMTDSGDHLTYNPTASGVWIDVTHGKISDEHSLRNEYAPQVWVDDTLQTENSPDTEDGDYAINYMSGDITFNEALVGTETVKCSRHEENGSLWQIGPIPGKVLKLMSLEVQFSEDLELTDTLQFEIWAGPYKLSTTYYQTIMDYINGSTRSYPVIPALGGSGWRGMNKNIHIFAWPYSEFGISEMKASDGIFVKLKLANDIPYNGTVAVATTYCLSEDEI